MSIFWNSAPRRWSPEPTWLTVLLVSVVAGAGAALLVVGFFS